MKTDKFITCECHGHGLYMDYFIEADIAYPSELYLTPYGSSSYWDKGSLGWRIKKAWMMLCKGTMSGGEVVLSEDNAKELQDYINSFLDKIKK